jgi:hypothetical protein
MNKKPRLGLDPLESIRDTWKEAEWSKVSEIGCETRDLALLTPSSQVNVSVLNSSGDSFCGSV